jgi:hypothetical protein
MENQEKREGEVLGFDHEQCSIVTSFLACSPPFATARPPAFLLASPAAAGLA